MLPAKKIRGSHGGHRIELVRVANPTRLLLGEGIETVLSVWRALSDTGSPFLEGCAVWSGVSLGNLSGKAVKPVAHPHLRIVNKHGRDAGPRKVPGPVPDLESRAVTVPASVSELILLGDGDSDPFATECALTRAAARNLHRPDGTLRDIRVPIAAAGRDFNDVLRGVA